MKIIIAGSRDIVDYERLCKVIDNCPFRSEITEVVSGMAKGVDEMGERWAEENNIPVKQFEAQWKALGRAAGPARNLKMAMYADGVIALMRLGSKGTANMISVAEERNLKVYYELYT